MLFTVCRLCDENANGITACSVCKLRITSVRKKLNISDISDVSFERLVAAAVTLWGGRSKFLTQSEISVIFLQTKFGYQTPAILEPFSQYDVGPLFESQVQRHHHIFIMMISLAWDCQKLHNV